MIASGFSWFHILAPVDQDSLLASLGIHGHTYVYIHAWLAAFVVILGALVARRQLNAVMARKDLSKWYADESLTARNFFELIVTGMKYFMDDLLDKKDVRTFIPLIGGLFLYILSCNIMGVFPGFLPPTDYVNTNVGMAVVSFLVFMYVGLSRDAVGFLKHLWGPVFILGFLLFPIEVFSLVLRPSR